MKRYLLIIAALLTQMSAVLAQQTEISYRLGEAKDIHKVAIIVSLTNSIEITGVGAKLYIPEDATCIYDDADFDEEPDYEKGDRCTKTHDMDNFTEKMTTAGKRVAFYFTSRKSKALTGTEGDVVTFYMDCSQLADGDYEITTKDNEAVTTDAKACFNAVNPTIAFTIKDHQILTAIAQVESTDDAPATIYTLDGIKRQKVEKKQINIVNGKKVVE